MQCDSSSNFVRAEIWVFLSSFHISILQYIFYILYPIFTEIWVWLSPFKPGSQISILHISYFNTSYFIIHNWYPIFQRYEFSFPPFKLGSHISILYIFYIPYFKSHISEIWLSNCDLIFQYPIPPLSFLSVTKIWTTFPLTVFLKHGQLDFYKASDSISDYLTLIFPSNFCRTEIWVGSTFKSI